MQFSREAVTQEFCEEVLPLLRLHWKEIAHYQDIELKPDFDLYIKMEQMGTLRVFVARDNTRKILGYSAFFVKNNIHYSDSIQAVQDVLYVDPERRGFGAKFILWCDQQLKEEGVQVVYQHIKVVHDFGHLLERMGYEWIEKIYARRLN